MTKQCSVTRKIICKGVAKQHGIPLTRRRDALGMVLGRRDNEWHTQTACGLSFAFQRTTHVIPTDRVAILIEAHEEECPQIAILKDVACNAVEEGKVVACYARIA